MTDLTQSCLLVHAAFVQQPDDADDAHPENEADPCRFHLPTFALAVAEGERAREEVSDCADAEESAEEAEEN